MGSCAPGTSAGGRKVVTTTGKDDDYVWGKRIEIRSAIPGDVLQFRNYVGVTETVTVATFDDDGSETTWTQISRAKRRHHTAIVAQRQDQKASAVVLEQNADPAGGRVQKYALPWESKEMKTIEHRQVKDAAGRLRPAEVVTTTTTKISGWIRAYRPVAEK